MATGFFPDGARSRGRPARVRPAAARASGPHLPGLRHV